MHTSLYQSFKNKSLAGFRQIVVMMTLFLAPLANVQAGVPNVVVTIKPIYELTKTVMKGIGEPKLLLEGIEDPHHFSMKPSHSSLLQKSDLVIWVGPTLEQFLVKPMISLKKRKVTLIALDGITLLSRDNDHSCLLKEACIDQSLVKKQIAELKAIFDKEVIALDPHIWLSVDNVMIMVKEIAFQLSAMDLENAKTYQDNAKVLIQRLQKFKGELNKQAAPLAHFHFIAFHDGFGYLEHEYKIKNSAADLVTHGHSPGLKTLGKLREVIKNKAIKCILIDPQHTSTLEQKLATDHNMTMVEADPLGLEIEGGDNHYFSMMTTLIDRMKSCLEQTGPSNPPKIKSGSHTHNHHDTQGHDHTHDHTHAPNIKTPHDHSK